MLSLVIAVLVSSYGFFSNVNAAQKDNVKNGSDDGGAGVIIDSSNFPDSVFRTYVGNNFDTYPDGYLSESELELITSIEIDEMGIEDLSGIEFFYNLNYLSCNYNYLKKLDVSNNTKLTYLSCSDNAIQELNIDNNNMINMLNCDHNYIKKIDASKCKDLDLYCKRNSLMELKLPETVYFLDCSYNQLTYLDLNCNGLVNVNCNNNQLEKLAVNGLESLQYLTCNDNKIKELSITNCPFLHGLICYNNQLTELDTTSFEYLYELDCANNNISKLNVDNNPQLFKLNCWNNYFSQVNISNQDLSKLRLPDEDRYEEAREFGTTIDKENKLMKFSKVKNKPDDKTPQNNTPKSIKPVIKLSKISFTYNEKVQKPVVTVKDGNTVLKAGTDYLLTFSNGCTKVGTYSVKVTLKGKYKGSNSASFDIKPKGTKIKGLTKIGKIYNFKWNKQTKEVSGYELQYSTNRTFKSGKDTKTAKIKKASTVKKKVKNLKSKKKYYVRIRTYKTVNGKKYYSSWSGVKSFKTK